MSEYRGDAGRLASEAMKDDVSKSLRLLSEASEASLKLLEDSYKRGLEAVSYTHLTLPTNREV